VDDAVLALDFRGTWKNGFDFATIGEIPFASRGDLT
jgi:hypothetical protein